MSQLNALHHDDNQLQVETYEFEPIKGYPRLHWKGKRPFRSTHYYPAQLKESYGDSVDGWMNEIYWGDNLQVMSHLLKKYRGKIKLIYIDPPFASNTDYKIKIKIEKIKMENAYNVFEEKQYTDLWINDEYLQYIFERLILIKELLSDFGTVYVHCDHRMNSYFRLILDDLFGKENLVNEIIWHYRRWSNVSKTFQKMHDTIYAYSKSQEYDFNILYQKYSNEDWIEDTVRGFVDGKLVRLKDENGNYLTRNKENLGVPMHDVWEDINFIGPTSSERLDYPTQKPEVLLERIIQASSNPGDIVFDCFMGCGTTQSVAMKLGRRFIGADINAGAVHTTVKRLINVAQDLKTKTDGKYYTGFSVFNVNHYDIFRNELEARDLLIKALEIEPLNSGSYFDGTKDEFKVKIMPVNRIATRADISQLITNLDYKSYERKKAESPSKTVDNIMLVCMGHEPDLAAHFQQETEKYRINLKVYDILRDGAHLTFKYPSEANIVIENHALEIKQFYPRMLLQKLKQHNETVSDFRELVESVMIDPYYDGSIFSPTIIDIPDKHEPIQCKYALPADHGKVAIKIIDKLSETLMEVFNG